MERRETYLQLTLDERVAISGLRMQGLGIREIGRRLGGSPGTIGREPGRNAAEDGTYESQAAQLRHALRRGASWDWRKLDPRGALWGAVVTMLSWKWSPRQIAATPRRVYPDDPDSQVSHETIYTAIYAYPRGELKRWRTRPQKQRSPRLQQSSTPSLHRCARHRPTARARRWLDTSSWRAPRACGCTSANRTAYGSAAPARTPTDCCASTVPKGTDSSVYSQDELDAIADRMNNRPRETLGWSTPLQTFALTSANAHRAPGSIQ